MKNDFLFKQLIATKGLNFLFGFLFLLCTSTVFSQNRTVNGTVTDDLGDVLIGVNVAVKGTTSGAITDINGNYSIPNVTAQSVLAFTYVGFLDQEITVGNQSVINVRLIEDSQALEEVIVVGYGTMRRSDVTGSVASVAPEDMLKRNPINLEQGLQGAAAGVMVSRTGGGPGGEANIQIRGVATVSGNTAPLYVVDGIQVGNNSNFLNPSDIERIEILKDASSTAIYGARGANGVILITTKKGDVGRTQLRVTASHAISQLQGKLKTGNVDDFTFALREARKMDGTGIFNQAFSEAYIGKLNYIDWQDAMTRTAYRDEVNVSASGGNQNTQANMSIGYLKNEGIVLNSSMERLTVRANIQQTIKDFITMGGSISFMHSADVSPSGGNNIRALAMLTPTMDYIVDGQLFSKNYNEKKENGDYYGFEKVSGETDIQNNQENPYAQNMRSDFTPNYSNRALANINLEIKFMPELSFRSIGAYSFSASDNSSFTKENTRLVNYSPSSFSMSQNQSNSLDLENYFTYTLRKSIHYMQLMAGNSVSRSWRHSLSASGRDYYSETYRDISLGRDTGARTGGGSYDTETRFASFYARLNYTFRDRYIFTGTVRRDGSSNFGSGKRWGVFPSAALAWRLSEEDFIKDLNIFSNLRLRLSWGKVGNAGGATSESVDQISTSRNAYVFGSINPATGYGLKNNFTLYDGWTITTAANRMLQWESNTTTNIGLDVGLLKGALSLMFEYFIRDSKDLLMSQQLRTSSGFSSVRSNIGHIRNQGLELTVTYNKRVNRDFNYGVTLTASTLKNKVIKIGDPINYSTGPSTGDGWTNYSVTKEGYPVASFSGWVVESIFTQAELDKANAEADAKGFDTGYQVRATKEGDFKFKDINGDGHIDDNDRIMLGDGFPKLNYGLNLSASYKQFDVSMYMYGIFGAKIFSYSKAQLTSGFRSAGGFNNTLKEYVYGSWNENNRNATMPRLTAAGANLNQRASDYMVEKGDYLKFATFQIGYNVPRNITSVVKIDGARIYFSFDNILTISSYNKYGDPEISSTTSGRANVQQNGYDGGRYPFPRQFALGLNLQF